MSRVARGDKVSDRVAKAILADIVQENLEPGTMLPSEVNMLARYGVARASLREALRILEVHGVIRVKAGPGGGPVVQSPDARHFGRSSALHLQFLGATVRELLDARRVIEPVLAYRAAELIDDQGVRVLHAISAADAGPHPELPTASSGFHELVAQLAGNRIMALFACALVEIQVEQLRGIYPTESFDEAAAMHEQIAEAITRGDAADAEQLMAKHMDTSAGFVREFFPTKLDEPIEWV